MTSARFFLSLAALLAVAVASSAAVCANDRPSHGMPGSKGCDRQRTSKPGTTIVVPRDQDRAFSLYLPTGYLGHRPLPLVLNLHGSGGVGEGQMRYSQIAPVADRHRFAVAAPNGAIPFRGGYAWNVPGVPLLNGSPVPPATPSDERYLLDVIATVKRTVCTNPRRVFLTGYSGGARMTSQMACDFSGRIAAIAPVAGLRAGVPRKASSGAWDPAPESCSPKRPVPVLAFHGTADRTNPYAGSNDARWGYGIDAALARWAALDGCAQGPGTSSVTENVDRVSYGRCRKGAAVALYRQRGGEHVWPTTASRGVDANELIWDFFAAHPLPAK
jgi:polyhydroxybutyrate depolymerase